MKISRREFCLAALAWSVIFVVGYLLAKLMEIK